jgi:hypothetical protein
MTKRFEKFHHLGEKLLFRNDENSRSFSEISTAHPRYLGHLCLQPFTKSFHPAVKIKSRKECKVYFEKPKRALFNCSIHDMPDFLMERFSYLCNANTKAYNKVLAEGARNETLNMFGGLEQCKLAHASTIKPLPDLNAFKTCKVSKTL